MSSSFDTSNFATEWVAAWNSHDPEAILSHYAPRSSSLHGSPPNQSAKLSAQFKQCCAAALLRERA